MAVITYDSKFDVEPGEYLAVFKELKDKDPFENSKFGGGNEPRYGWQFEIVGPPGTPMMGKIIEQNTGTNPTKRSGLIRLLDMMVKGGIQPKQSVDPTSFVGRLYRVNWKVNPDSDKGNCYIAFIAEVGADASTTPPPRTVTNPHAPPAHTGQLVNAAPPGTRPVQSAPLVPEGTLPVPPAPPPRRGAQAAPRPDGPAQQPAVQRYFVNTGAAPAPLMTLQEVRVYIDQNHVSPKDLDLCPEGTSEWKPADAFGFEEPIPY